MRSESCSGDLRVTSSIRVLSLLEEPIRLVRVFCNSAVVEVLMFVIKRCGLATENVEKNLLKYVGRRTKN